MAGEGEPTESAVFRNMKNVTSPYESRTFGSPLSLRVDGGVGAMTISPSGRDVALASHSGLFIIDLEDPFTPPRWLHHRTSWEVADVQWSPHASRPYWIVSTSNQKAIVWNVALPSNRAVEHVLHGHKRAITDINFHFKDPERLATCSVDSFVHIWDFRESRRPVQSFADWTAGATQVKWNRRDPHILASSHGRYVYVWDDRKGSIPVQSLHAHSGKVNGIDWSRIDNNVLLSCSNDRTVKLWNCNKPETPLLCINTDFPVWRARHTPFGEGCVIMPLRGGENSVYLHDLQGMVSPMKMTPSYVYRGHSEPVKEFVWRSRGHGDSKNDDREFQLVTWSKDNDLRLWPSDPSIPKLVHFDNTSAAKMPITRLGAKYQTYHEDPEDPSLGAKGKFSRRRSKNSSFSATLGTSPIHTTSIRNRTSSSGKKGGPSFMTNAAADGDSYDYNEGYSNHLTWMAGVRMGRSAFAPFDVSMGSTSVSWKNDMSPSNLGEEVSMVGHKFPKVRFEKISVSTGQCIISLYGPWGNHHNKSSASDGGDDSRSVDETSTISEDNELIFLRVNIKFPPSYPLKAPAFTIEEDGKLSKRAIADISTELVSISKQLTSKGRYCLEPCLRYLLGDKVKAEDYFGLDEHEENENMLLGDSEDAVISFEDEEDDINDLANSNDRLYSSSSDEEDNEVLGIHSVEQNTAQTFENVPLPKGCGAVWSKGGDLVCFFVLKTDPQVRNGAAVPGNAYRKSHEVNESSEAEDQDDSVEYESDDDLLPRDDTFHHTGSGGWLFPLDRTFNRSGKVGARFLTRGKLSVSYQEQLSNAGLSQNAEGNMKNVVQVYNFQNLIPSKRVLAAEYQVLGKEPKELASHNSDVALKNGFMLEASCWKAIEKMLSTTMECDMVTLLGHTGDIPYSEVFREYSQKFKYLSFNWGSHPFGKQWLIPQLFSFFVKIKNTQMLADISCVLSGGISTTTTSKQNYTISAVTTPSISNEPIRSPFNHDLITRDSSSYFPNLFHHETPDIGNSTHSSIQIKELETTPKTDVTRAVDIPSTVKKPSSNAASPSPSRETSMMSLSPEKFMSARKMMAGLFSRNSIVNLTKETSQSQQQQQRHGEAAGRAAITRSESDHGAVSQRSTPSGFNALRSNMLGHAGFFLSSAGSSPKNETGTNTAYGSSVESSTDSRAIHPQQFNKAYRESHPDSQVSPQGQKGSTTSSLEVTFEYLDEDLIDYDDSFIAATPKLEHDEVSSRFLNPEDTTTHMMYRHQYASILYSWGLIIESLEVLKFNYSSVKDDGKLSSQVDEYHSADIMYRTMDRETDDPEIIITDTLAHRKLYLGSCQLCRLPVQTRLLVCANCEHVTHAKCSEMWWETETDCPSGCGCHCLEYITT